MTIEQVHTLLDQAAMFPKEPGLTNMLQLLSALGNPERRLAFVHIAGTNGKGSTAAFLSTALQKAGYRTGLFTSPYIHTFNERIQVDGIPIPDESLCRIMERIQVAALPLSRPATFFELVTAAGLLYFQETGCDIVILEVGLGGRLDCTNVIPPPVLSVITQIGLDHTGILGDTLTAIAGEKAGIIKAGSRAVVLSQAEEVLTVIQAACAEKAVPLAIAEPLPYILQQGRAVLETPNGHLPLGLLGTYQAKNASLALCCLGVLSEAGFPVPFEAIREGFETVRWPGRFELLGTEPAILLDGAHNPQGITALCESVQSCFPEQAQNKRCIIVAGMMQDKDRTESLATLGTFAKAMIAIASPEARALKPEALCGEMLPFCPNSHYRDTIEEGLALALSLAETEDLILICGSLHICGPVRAYLKGRKMP